MLFSRDTPADRFCLVVHLSFPWFYYSGLRLGFYALYCLRRPLGYSPAFAHTLRESDIRFSDRQVSLSALTNLGGRRRRHILHLIEAEALLRQLALRISSMLILILPQIILRRNFPPLSHSCDTTIANTLDLSEFNMLYLTHHLLQQYDIEKV